MHNIAREELIAKIGINNLHLSDIMAHTDRMKALVTFINRTGRLRGSIRQYLAISYLI